MDAFENLVATVLRDRGYWVEESFKVDLSKEEKVEIGRPSSPRWELDVVAYRPTGNEVLVVECKSYLDSRGVSAAALQGELDAGTYKLFREDTLRKVVFRRLAKQLTDRGSVLPNAKVTLCLAAGLIRSESDRNQILSYFDANEWKLFDENWLVTGLVELASRSYQNSLASVVAKLLIRNPEILRVALQDHERRRAET